MKALIDSSTDPFHPVLIMGDFNIATGTTERLRMLSILDVKAEDDLFAEFGPSAPEDAFTFNQERNAYARNWFSPEPPTRLDSRCFRLGEWD